MRKIIQLNIIAIFIFISSTSAQSNIFGGEKVMIVGTFNGFSTTPYDADYRTTNYRKLSFTTGSPNDGRGQWMTTMNIKPVGGDFAPINMNGGGGAGNSGFLIISGPSTNRFLNKWAFASIGQGVVDAINFTSYNIGEDMGMNMSTTGYYTLVFNDAGYTATDAKYYLGYTLNVPVNISRTTELINPNNSVTVVASTSAIPSPQEKVYIRYTTGNDFAQTGLSTVIQATGNGTSYSATIPALPASTVVRYYLFTSTKDLAFFTSTTPLASEIDKSLAVLRYDDFANQNYTYTLAPIPVKLISFDSKILNQSINTKWVVTEEDDVSEYNILKSCTGIDFRKIGVVPAKNNLTPLEEYYFLDTKPFIGKNYYQLEIIKINGEKKYSNISFINYKKNDKAITVFSTSNSKLLILGMQNISVGNYQLNIFNSIGQIVYSQKLNRSNIFSNEVLKLNSSLQKGVYTIKLNNQFESITQAFFLQ